MGVLVSHASTNRNVLMIGESLMFSVAQRGINKEPHSPWPFEVE